MKTTNAFHTLAYSDRTVVEEQPRGRARSHRSMHSEDVLVWLVDLFYHDSSTGSPDSLSGNAEVRNVRSNDPVGKRNP